MKPGFALNLSHDGIGLLRRTATGWDLLGEVPLDAPDLSERLADLRALAGADGALTSKVIIPGSQILYTTVAAPGPRASARRQQIAAALDGLTPYPVEDLVFDWSGHGETVDVAVVARETLREAEGFAEDWGFHPVSFVAVPDPGRFAGEPWFGVSEAFAATADADERVERDQDPVPLRAAQALYLARGQADLSGSTAIAGGERQEDQAISGTDPGVSGTEPQEDEVATGDAVPVTGAEPEGSTAEPAEGEAVTEDEAPSRTADPGMSEADTPSDTTSDATGEVAPDLAADVAPDDLAPPEDAEPEEGETSAPQGEAAPVVSEAAAAAESAPLAPEGDALAPDAGVTEDMTSAKTAPETGGETPFPEAGDAVSPAAEADPARSGDDVAAPPLTAGSPEDRGVNPDEDTNERATPVAAVSAVRHPAGAQVPAGPAIRADRPVHRAPALPGVAREGGGTPPREPAPVVARKALRDTPHRLLLGMTAGLVLVLLAASLWAARAEDGAEPDQTETVAALSPEAVAPQPAMAEAQPEAAPAGEAAAAEGAADETETSRAGVALAPEATEMADDEAEPVVLAALTTEPAPAPRPAPETPVVLAANEIVPTAKGVVTPQGITLFSGRPPAVPKPRPGAVEQAAQSPAPDAAAQAPKVRPVERPAAIAAAPQPEPSAVEESTPAADSPAADPALSGFRPKTRPMAVISAGEDARRAEADAARKAEEAAQATEGATEQAVSVSRRPAARPRNYRQSVEQALAAAIASEPVPAPQATAPQVSAQQAAQQAAAQQAAAQQAAQKAAAQEAARQQQAAATAQLAAQKQAAQQQAAQQKTARDPTVELDEPEPTMPTRKMPTSASVAKQATQKDALKLREMNLIGLYGAQGSRRALVRMPSGKMIKVGLGDVLDGGRVTAIGDGQLTYQKGSRLYQLKLLQGS